MTTQNAHTPFLTLLTDGQVYTVPSIAANQATFQAQAAKVTKDTGGNWMLIGIPLPVALTASDLLATADGLADEMALAFDDVPAGVDAWLAQLRTAIAKAKGGGL